MGNFKFIYIRKSVRDYCGACCNLKKIYCYTNSDGNMIILVGGWKFSGSLSNIARITFLESLCFSSSTIKFKCEYATQNGDAWLHTCLFLDRPIHEYLLFLFVLLISCAPHLPLLLKIDVSLCQVFSEVYKGDRIATPIFLLSE